MKDACVVPDYFQEVAWRGHRIKLVVQTVKLYQWLYFDSVESEYMLSRHRQTPPVTGAKRLDHTMIEVEV